MATKAKYEAAAEHQLERRIIRVDSLPDPAGIAAALRRAFDVGPANCDDGSDHMFDDLLKRLH